MGIVVGFTSAVPGHAPNILLVEVVVNVHSKMLSLGTARQFNLCHVMFSLSCMYFNNVHFIINFSTKRTPYYCLHNLNIQLALPQG